MAEAAHHPKHLPYTIDPRASREAYYEVYWKKVGLALLCKHVKPQGQSILDYGSGRGEGTAFFSDAGFKITAADVDPECVRLSSRYGPATVLNPDDPVGQFGAKSFDIVTCFHVLEHVDSPKKTLNQLREIARSHVLLAVPNLRYLNLLFTRRIDISIVNEGHLQSWDHWHLRSLAERHCGLELVEWGFDATKLPILSNLLVKTLGNRATIALETGLFRRMFPFHGISVLGLFRVH
jgi:SAM-dependent methyltransferase